MRKYILIIATILLSGVFTQARSQSIDFSQAQIIAKTAFCEILNKNIKSIGLEEDYYVKSINESPALYIFNETNGGFVIVSGDERISPILGYSYAGSAELNESDWNPEFAYWMGTYFEQIEYVKTNNLAAQQDIQIKWQTINNGDELGLRPTKDVAPLLVTTWNQGCGYNALCPVDASGPCGRVYTGCVATAMAQVIRHLEYPVNGIGDKCYTHYVYGEQCADFAAATYDYSSMTNSSGNAEVAELMYHCGVSVSMNYSPTGSGAYTNNVDNAYEDYFDFKNVVILSRGTYAPTDWNRILRNEIDNNRPFYYSGSGSSGGHAFVFDGYQGTDYFHVNWGWGGSQNGYFYCSDLTPGGYSFNSNQRAVIGLVPAPLFTNLDVSSSTNLTCATPVTGDISTGTDYINHYLNSYPVTVGKELVYDFTTTLPGRIRVKITNNVGGDVYALLLNHPHQDSVISYGTNGLILDGTDPGAYYIAVEGVNGAEPTFDIEVVCPTIDADLIINYGMVSPEFLEENLANVSFKSNISNIGNTDAGTSTIEYFLSDDNIYDGSDVPLGSNTVPSISIDETINFETILTIPPGITTGNKYVIFNLDRANVVVETDDENIATAWVEVPTPGLLDCSSSVSLTDNVWYYGNTETDGINNVQDYWSANALDAPEIIHSFIAPYSGLANIYFTEKQAGQMNAMVLPICNENSYLADVWFNNATDTIAETEFHVTAGTEYFVIVDSKLIDQGLYGVKIDLPEECPIIEITPTSPTELCDGESFPILWTYWNYSNYQWYKDGLPITNENTSSIVVGESGSYHVEVAENGCLVTSNIIDIAMSFPPDTAQISTSGITEFCDGESVLLEMDNSVLYPLQWTLNGEDIPSANSDTFVATESGTYRLVSTNGSCSVSSVDFIDVTVNNNPIDIDEYTPLPSDTIEFYYTFENDNIDIVNNYSFSCWDFVPTDDRDGNFWQARDYTSEDVMGYSPNYYEIPNEFTLSFWIKTTTIEGGMISSFVDDPWVPSDQDAVVYMSDDGKLHYYMSNGGTPTELISTASYNDGAWHNVLITHDFGILMEIDGGDEFLQIGTSVTSQVFDGYWTFAGPSIPADALDIPTSAFFNGSIDDMLCLNESKYHIRNYIDDTPKLFVSVPGDTVFCDMALAYFEIENSQNNIEYRAWNTTTSTWNSIAETGTGSTIMIGGDMITETSEFEIYAVDLVTMCETLLMNTYHFGIYTTETPTITINSDVVMPMCVGTTVNFTSSITNSGSTQIYEWYVNDVPQGVDDPNFSYSGLTEADTIYSVVWGDYMCQSVDSAISNEIVVTFTPELTPSVSIVNTPASFVCEGSTITFVANSLNCGTSPTYQWYREGLPVGTNSNIYSSDDFADNEELYVIVTSDYLCSTVPTVESNHLFTVVSIPPEAAMAITGGYCVSEEVCFTYTGETTGLTSVEWEVSDGGPTITFSGIGPHCFTPSGSYLQISPLAYNADGCYDTVLFVNPLLSPSLTPSVSITSDQVGSNCQWETVVYTASPVNCGSNPIYQWYNNGVPVGTNSDTYSVFNSEDGDEIYVIVTNDLACATSSTAESNHIFADVYIVPQASISVTGGSCINNEICMTYTGETAGVVSIEWDIWDGILIEYTGFGPHCFTPTISDPHISLTVYDTNGCFDSTSNYLTISTAPNIDIFDTIYKCSDSYGEITIDPGFTTYLWSNGDDDNHFVTMDEGLYYVTVTNEFGCSDIDSIIIENYPDHSFDLVSDTTICMDEMITLEINNAYVYNDVIWDDGVGTVWHEVSPTIGYMGDNPQFIYVEATDDNCTYDDTIYIHFDICEFIDKEGYANIEIYPNPAKSFVTFESNQQIEEIIIYDITGKTIYTEKPNSIQFNINVENWAEAVYYIQLTTITGEVIKIRFIKI